MSKLKAYPKLLVAAEFPPNDTGGGGALVRQVLSSYPKEQIYWWSCDPYHGAGAGQPLSMAFRFRLPHKLYPARRLARLRSFVLEYLWSPLAAAHLARVVRIVAPDQIWSVLWGWVIPPLQRTDIVKRYRTHGSLWDYSDIGMRGRWFGASRAARFTQAVEQLFTQAHTCDVVSLPMRHDMYERTGRDASMILHSGLEPTELEILKRSPVGPGQELRLAHAGTAHVPASFELVIRALKKIRPALPRPLRLEFFGGRSYEHATWFDPEWMQSFEHLEEPAFKAKLSQCDWGLLAMDLTDADPRYNRYSFPNKFGTYLASGMPVIVIGHETSSAAQMMRRFPVGLCSHAANVENLAAFLHGALSEPTPRQRFRSAILECANTEFNMDQMRSALWRCFGIEK